MKKHYGYVYKIVCNLNGKIYVGQTVRTLNQRWHGHRYAALKSENSRDTYITRSIRKYGSGCFSISIICKANSIDELNHREKLCIRLFRSRETDAGYNLAEGGLNQRASEETKRKMSLAGKGKKKPVGFGQKIREARLGTKQPNSVKVKCSNSQKGGKSAWYGRKHTKETRLKIGKAHKGLKKIQTSSKLWVKIKCLQNNKIYKNYSEAAIDLKIKAQQIAAFFTKAIKTAGGYTFVKV